VEVEYIQLFDKYGPVVGLALFLSVGGCGFLVWLVKWVLNWFKEAHQEAVAELRRIGDASLLLAERSERIEGAVGNLQEDMTEVKTRLIARRRKEAV
jgi:hypothetical protein